MSLFHLKASALRDPFTLLEDSFGHLSQAATTKMSWPGWFKEHKCMSFHSGGWKGPVDLVSAKAIFLVCTWE